MNINKISKVALRIIVTSIGLKMKYESVLLMYYVDEKNYHEIAEILCLREQSVKNLVCKAKKELESIIKNEFDLFDDDIKKYIKLLINE